MTALACRIHSHSDKPVKWRRFLAPGTFHNGPSSAKLEAAVDIAAGAAGPATTDQDAPCVPLKTSDASLVFCPTNNETGCAVLEAARWGHYGGTSGGHTANAEGVMDVIPIKPERKA